MRLVSLRLRQKDELLDRGRVSVPFALFLWSLRAWALISTGRQKRKACKRMWRVRKGQEKEQLKNNKKEETDPEKWRTQKKMEESTVSLDVTCKLTTYVLLMSEIWIKYLLGLQ